MSGSTRRDLGAICGSGVSRGGPITNPTNGIEPEGWWAGVDPGLEPGPILSRHTADITPPTGLGMRKDALVPAFHGPIPQNVNLL